MRSSFSPLAILLLKTTFATNYAFSPLAEFIVLSIRAAMENKIESATEIEEETGNYLQLFLFRAPKKNHDAIVQNQEQFVPWFKKHGVRIEYYQLGESETQGAIESAKENGMIFWKVLPRLFPPPLQKMMRKFGSSSNTFGDHKHCEEVYAKMMQDKSIEPLGNEFFGLVTQGKSLVTGAFIRLRP
jgi:hypothetical protein